MGRSAKVNQSIEQAIDELTALPPGLSASEVTRRTGISRATLHRIAEGAVIPSLQTLHELAVVQGKEIEIRLKPLSDPHAAAAARVIIDGDGGAWSGDEATQRWVERLDRLARSSDGDYLAILHAAGRASSLLHRTGAVFMRGDNGPLRLASAGDASGGTWAISGKAALEVSPDNPVAGPSVLWVDDVERAASLLSETHKRVTASANAHVIIAEANPSTYIGEYAVGALRYVAPLQMLLDCVGLGGRQEEIAMSIAKEWSR
ncbi:hypothetical protein SAMN06295879_0412 [Agreia bicolorata]|uniref:Helix-turn-helix n=1 Tax=Agreia bicolorata TaxID=110935 RepID=A0A1T4WX95_9MICO|nr:helix-turn-helix transcriptional regulator [Agreia bicolorata]SKA81983.1 hypothetical protein SAMN06295879_0412 [Agreia bicolorata]